MWNVFHLPISDSLAAIIALGLIWSGLILVGMGFRQRVKGYKKKGMDKEAYSKKLLYQVDEGFLILGGGMAIYLTLSFAIGNMIPVLHPVGLWFAAPFLCCLVAADFLLTKKGLKTGERELNPIARLIIGKFGINKLPILPAAVLCLVLTFVWDKAPASSQYSIFILYLCVVGWNVTVLRRGVRAAQLGQCKTKADPQPRRPAV